MIGLIKLSGAAPTEFRMFQAGLNDTTQGEFLFDEQAAASVMSAYQKHGVDIMIDLEHLSLNKGQNFDPDARGWAKLEVRNGELWAVDVRWTPEGAKRLANKTQRYISPAFDVEPETNRILRILNMALTALPATDEAMSLVAARQKPKHTKYQRRTNTRTSTMLNDADKQLATDWLASVNDLAGKAEDAGLKALAEAVAGKLSSLIDGEPAGDAPAPEATSAAPVAASQIAEAAKRLTGKTDPEEVEAALIALGGIPAQYVALTAEVSRLKAAEEKREVEALIAANRNKITPALSGWARTQSFKALSAFVEAAPVIMNTEVCEPPVMHGNPANEMTEEVERIALSMGQDPKQLLSFINGGK